MSAYDISMWAMVVNLIDRVAFILWNMSVWGIRPIPVAVSLTVASMLVRAFLLRAASDEAASEGKAGGRTPAQNRANAEMGRLHNERVERNRRGGS